MPFGGGGFGLTPWGGGAGPATIALLSALALRENVVRLGFNAAVKFTGLLDDEDGSNPARYSVVSLPGTFGLDELETRPVDVVLAALAPGDDTAVDVTLDRPMSPFPGQYLASANGIRSTLGALLAPGAVQFPSVLAYIPTPQADAEDVGLRDFAQPDTLEALQSVGVSITSQNPVLGGLPADATGDYAADAGLVSLKKRIFRRIDTAIDGFLHLQGYGSGLPQRAKALASVANRQAIAASVEQQVSSEPEVLRCRCTLELGTDPGLAVFVLLVKTVHFGAFKSTRKVSVDL